ncbi:MAG: DUF4783 domain-containing protein [Prevotellaceae bacterium]|jgi:hypothetical protein|nr:DUF4783 domain-containing protein [Prevotellaceae bacterium]
MKTFLIFIFTFTLFSPHIYAQNNEKTECEEIIQAIKTADIEKLSPNFADMIECDMFGKSNINSKAQTVQIVKDFFEQNKPKQFQVNHKGVKGQTKFMIGTYTNVTGKKYRISWTVKQDLIIQLRVENSV